MPYGHLGSMRTRPGRRDEVVAILTEGAAALREAGCHLYVVGVSETDDDLVWVSEVWESQAHHEGSLELPAVREQISRAMPMLTGEFETHPLRVVGGLGVES
ncbi:putative quinol monooxygenase [Actinotalea sp. K2]|uniref:putative quinol monooxygenase n=1 Tax=Actinotalea sp. K2 TaxID=2939438 RepID=UPI0020182E01|nr:putative quinol monooxygenase [Actinotalea sp. K2]MCL3861401.1 antibiotic biosynthesis monooxygenase [Actinotalea sp. K2]